MIFKSKRSLSRLQLQSRPGRWQTPQKPSVWMPHAQACKRFGTTIEVVPETSDGDVDVAELERMIWSGPKPKLVAVSHIATNSGVQLAWRLYSMFCPASRYEMPTFATCNSHSSRCLSLMQNIP